MLYIIPELWAQEIILMLQKGLVAAAVANRNVAGAISAKGDKLHIIGAGEVNVDDYPDADNITYQETDDSDAELDISIDKYFAIKVEDKDRKQAAVSWEQIYAARGGYRLRDAIDALLLAEYLNATLDNYESGSTPWQLGTAGADVPALFASLAKQLDDADAPAEGRFVILPPIGVQAIRLYVSGRATAWGDQVAVNGKVGQFLGFDVFMSRNCTTAASVIHGLAGVAGQSIAYAQQINPEDIESLRLEGRFAIRNLQLFEVLDISRTRQEMAAEWWLKNVRNEAYDVPIFDCPWQHWCTEGAADAYTNGAAYNILDDKFPTPVTPIRKWKEGRLKLLGAP